MKKLITILVLVLAFSTLAAAEFPYTVISWSPDNVTFQYDCHANKDCMSPGAEYCGDNYVKMMKCNNGNLCQVTCNLITTQKATVEWSTGTYSISPLDRRANQPITITLKDTRNGKPLWWDVEVYYGGTWVGSLSTIKSTTGEIPPGAVVVELLKTDRWGRATFTPENPGQYFFKTLGKLIRFSVADESGNVFNCGDGECEEDLGEDIYVCAKDCNKPRNVTPITPPPQVCGDGSCGSTESQQSCPQDCGQPQGQQGAQQSQQSQPQGDNSMMLILIIAACAVVAAAGLLYKTKFAGSKPAAPKQEKVSGQQPKGKCPQCGANMPAGDMFCSSCGNRVIAPQ
jgi:hypothetical protein